MYAAIGSRPDIAYGVSLLGTHAEHSTEKYIKIAKRIIRYLSGTSTLGIQYKKGGNQIALEGFIDSDWGSNPEDRRSVIGYIFCINGSPVSWSSKRQKTIALSSIEAEYMAVTQAAKEAIWIIES
jgi:hypothetical protein